VFGNQGGGLACEKRVLSSFFCLSELFASKYLLSTGLSNSTWKVLPSNRNGYAANRAGLSLQSKVQDLQTTGQTS
ncbi:hypothetical protein AVEN_226725-1, partial [Araneus ventricosus]